MKLGELKPAVEKKTRRRVGRGIGSGSNAICADTAAFGIYVGVDGSCLPASTYLFA